MIRLRQIKLPVTHTQEALEKKICKLLRITPKEILSYQIRKQSLDARKKPDLFYSYIIDVKTAQEAAVVHKAKHPDIILHQEPPYRFPQQGTEQLKHQPVIIGAGPAGLFCGLLLARQGYRPVILERGDDVDTRTRNVDRFWQEGIIDIDSNVQFGEGGAGAFSDGKLNTLVKDPQKRNHLVMEILAEFGADPAILYQNKPHIGTDVLSIVVKNIRSEIIRLGGTVRFRTCVTDFMIEQNVLKGVRLSNGELLPAETVVLAVGHSARDTFQTLYEHHIPMEQKAFAVGLRIQHPQAMINLSQYGQTEAGDLGAASYKLTKQASNGRGVYSFCMCPGGYVVNASSEPGMLAVNGMSYHARDGKNANSALIVTVTPADFAKVSPAACESDFPLAGVYYQRHLEQLAYQCAQGAIPVQLYQDYIRNKTGTQLGAIDPQVKGRWAFANLRELLPDPLNDSLLEAMTSFGRMIDGFDRPDAVLAGVESRTSSPLRILRDSQMESPVKGLYPCGEGAGYAGGITSAAMDGIKTAEAIGTRYYPN
ncbi:MAG: NAD(P)/FAD-dependent oxidoreductase [Lachnospiraceae bacterium]